MTRSYLTSVRIPLIIFSEIVTQKSAMNEAWSYQDTLERLIVKHPLSRKKRCDKSLLTTPKMNPQVYEATLNVPIGCTLSTQYTRARETHVPMV